MVGRSKNERRVYLAVIAVVALAVGVVVLTRSTKVPPSTTTNPSRLTYASLYDGLWRQDQGRGAVLMTATLFIPPMIRALGDDQQRSGVDDQLWNATKSLSNRQLALYITFDSVSGYLSDQQIQAALNLTMEPVSAVSSIVWQPIIGGQSTVNANLSVQSQRGLAIVTWSREIDWLHLQTVKLEAKNIADQPVRQFVWNQVGSLLSAE